MGGGPLLLLLANDSQTGSVVCQKATATPAGRRGGLWRGLISASCAETTAYLKLGSTAKTTGDFV